MQTILDAVLRMLVGRIIGELLAQRLVAQILHLINRATIHVELEKIVEIVAQQVVIVVGEHILLSNIGAYVVEFHPKHGPALHYAKLIFAMQHGAQCLNPRFHLVAASVKFPLFDNIVAQHLATGNIGILNAVAGL
ncbi:Uncharacterised protein [Chlamydia trachomatis]|nr:Uncharacterised protein [Chlamydia trachomatis]